MKKLNLGIPKGSLQSSTIEMMQKAGYQVEVRHRSYFPAIDDDELNVRLFRPQAMSRFVEKGVIDAGLTGADWVAENESDVHEVAKLVYAKQQLVPVRWVVAVAEGSDIESVEDLEDKRISTELVNVTQKFLDERGINATIEFSHGATETKVPDLVDAIVELTETGRSLREANLRVVETVMESTTCLIACKESWRDEWKRNKIESLGMLFKGAMVGQNKVGLKMNVEKEALQRVLDVLPALRKPTVSPLSEESGYAVETVLEEKIARDLIPDLKRAGAQGIIEYALNKVVL
ncbi:MAG: ATP phosphoribosyltransferase [Planctomycetes bacterium]|nr:ATP phosphoribosyltransferase [Planctomycetota bacterium]